MRAGLDQEGPLTAPERAEEPPRPAAQKIHHDPVPTQITASPRQTESLQRPPFTRTKLQFDTDSVRDHISRIRCQFGIQNPLYLRESVTLEESGSGSGTGCRGSHCATGPLDSVNQREVLDPNLSHESSTVAIFSLLFIPAASERLERDRAVMTVTA